MKSILAMSTSIGLIEIKSGLKTVSSGTGFLVGDGYFMSAYHVFAGRIGKVKENKLK